MMPRLIRVAALLLLPLPLLVGATTVPAQAFGYGPEHTTQYGTVGGCYASAGPSYLGLRCLGARGGGDPLPTPAQLLCEGNAKYTAPVPTPPPNNPYTQNAPAKEGCDPVPTCWDEAMGPADQAQFGIYNTEGPPRVTYYWFKCLYGMNTSMQVDGNLQIKQYPIGKGDGEPKYKLTDRQNKMIETLIEVRESSNVPPAPLPVVSPTPNAKVGFDLSFYDGKPSVVTVSAGRVRLQAREVEIRIHPTGAGTGEVTTPAVCKRQPGDLSDPGVRVGYEAKPGETRANTPPGTNDTPGGCWYRYKRSSADQPGQTYQVESRSHWKVYQSTDGGRSWDEFIAPATGKQVEFDKLYESPLQVTEIQAINYLPVIGGKS